MTQTSRPNEPRAVRPMLDEADIGSGEKTPAQRDTEEMIRQIPPLPASPPASPPAGAGDAKRPA